LSEPQQVEIIVIGAGPAGLCAAAAARSQGLEPLIIEADSRIGGVWHRVEPDLRCLSPRQRDLLPDGSFPAGEGLRARADEVLACLLAFQDRQRFALRLNCRALALETHPAGLLLRTSKGSFASRRIVVATGVYGKPQVPALPGRFEGLQQHSSEVKAADINDGEQVTVVGSGNSAVDLVARLLARDLSVSLAARSGLGKALPIATGPAAAVMWWASSLPTRWLPHSLRCSDTVPKVDDDLQRAEASGRLSVYGEALALEPTGLMTAGARLVAADRIIWATGFRRDLTWISGLNLDDRGQPSHDRGLSTEVQGLAFMGLPCMRNRRSGFLRGFAADARDLIRRLA
tara:strand:- start:517 stop:1551 length:1035 start_codon:yes stop_codon:yes gene_type:complete